MWKRPVFRAPSDRSRRTSGSDSTDRDGSQVVRKLTRIIRVDPDGSRHEYLHETGVNGSSDNTDSLIQKAIADSPFTDAYNSPTSNQGSVDSNQSGVETSIRQ